MEIPKKEDNFANGRLARNIYEWYLKAKKDGKIDANEGKELIDIVDDGVNNIKDNIKK